jgi:hypothetical protein
MPAPDTFPSEITAAEIKAGFKVMEVPNPDAHFAGQPKTMHSVIYPLGQSHRVIKFRWPDGRVWYKLQTFGRYKFGPQNRELQWLPDCDCALDNPAFAIEYLQTRIGDAGASRFIELHDPKHKWQQA